MIDVDMGQLSLAQQLLTRQSEHADAIGKHLEQYARMTAGELGLILMLFKPIGDAVVDAGIGVANLSRSASSLGAERMGQTVQAYQDAEERAHELMSRVILILTQQPLPPYQAPEMPTLGGAIDQAPSRYGEPDGNLFNQIFWDGFSFGEWADETSQRVTDRIRSGFSDSREVVETSDARSYLPRPQGEDPEIESIRWSAGPIFGGVDWIWEQLFGYSLLEEITKPFVGDWERMREASQAWKHTGDALTAISQNYMGLLPPLAVWRGKGSEAFLAAAGVISQAHTVAAGPTGLISTALTGLIFACKQAVSLILGYLKQLGYDLMLMAGMAAVPVAGWLVDAVVGAIKIMEWIDQARKMYKIINLIYDLVSSMAGNVSSAVDAALRMSDLYEGIIRAGAVRVGV
ncbi:hypothetical protein [Microbacterium soli]|uniref:WXG100 family type VII secretion target n=1 Tax=Microbacterium soli TaxID=446075 RepID=A0ABP7N1L8_9MICO